jgi:TfoX/Sxy family transcriptional regulator of competence genes
MSIDILADRLRIALAGHKFTERRMFGGVCFMLNGNMALAASPNGLLVRVGKEGNDAALRKPGVRPMIQRGKPLAGYIYVDETGAATARQLSGWVETAVTHVSTLPANARPAKGPARQSATQRTSTKRGKS